MNRREIVAGLKVEWRTKIKEAEDLQKAIDLLDPPSENGPGPAPRRRRTPIHKQEQRTLDFLRSHPDRPWSPGDLNKALDLAPGSMRNVVRRLVKQGLVTQANVTTRGLPIIQHKDVAIKAGQGPTS